MTMFFVVEKVRSGKGSNTVLCGAHVTFTASLHYTHVGRLASCSFTNISQAKVYVSQNFGRTETGYNAWDSNFADLRSKSDVKM
jgi:hypothetical protein